MGRKYIPNKFEIPDSVMNDDIVPTGKYKDCHRLEVPMSYIHEVTKPNGKFYSKLLAKFFYREAIKLKSKIKRDIRKQVDDNKLKMTWQMKGSHQAWRKPQY